MSLLSRYHSRYEDTQQEEFSLEEYLNLCKSDPSIYASAAERILMAIGEPEVIDTSTDPRLSRIFSNKIIKRYPAFEDFYGMEECIESIVSYFKHAAQGLEEKKQILYCLGAACTCRSLSGSHGGWQYFWYRRLQHGQAPQL